MEKKLKINFISERLQIFGCKTKTILLYVSVVEKQN